MVWAGHICLESSLCSMEPQGKTTLKKERQQRARKEQRNRKRKMFWRRREYSAIANTQKSPINED